MARREINAKTDIAFEYEEIKTGRKVTALRFRITKSARAANPEAPRNDPRIDRLIARLLAHGMADNAAHALVQAHDPELVEWALSDLTRRLKGKEKLDNPAGWLRRAIEEDWRPQPSLFVEGQAQARETEREADRQRQKLDEETANRRKARNAYEKTAIMQFLDTLSEDERQTIEQGFREHLAAASISAFVAKKFDGGASWYADPIIKAEAIRYLKSARQDFCPVLSEFAEGASDFSSSFLRE